MRESTPLLAGLGGCVIVAGFGFITTTTSGRDPQVPYMDLDAGWLSPALPVVTEVPGDSAAARVQSWGPTPFLDAGERALWGPELCSVDGMSIAGSNENSELRAVIHTTDGPIALIGDLQVRVGDVVGSVRIERIEKDRVLVHHDDGARWLEVAARNGIDIKETIR